MASVHVEASPFTSHEAYLGFCQPQEWRQPGQKMFFIYLFEIPSSFELEQYE